VTDKVYLKPGLTAFETAERFCRSKDLDQIYSKNKMNPLHDTKCVLPITHELQKSSRNLCINNPNPLLLFSVDIASDNGVM
jgi:hypothetical protein